MILANLRERLTPADWALVIERLAPGSSCTLGEPDSDAGIQALLDAPDLLERLRATPGLSAPSAALLLYVAVRQTLRQAGLDDVRLSDYLGALLLEFGLRQRATRIAPHDDQVYGYLTDIMADVATTPGRRGFLLRAHLGNYSLWLAGIFPDYIAARRVRNGGPDLDYYDALGATGFRLAADHALARTHDLVDVYREAADSFGAIRVALNRLSDRMFFPNVSSPDRLMRQVGDAFGAGGNDNN